MKILMDALEQIEKLIYKIIVWLVLIPKTLLQIILYPRWAPEYIKQELGTGESRFDEYFSPIILLLIVALIPFVVWGLLPDPGIEINSPSMDEPTPNRMVDFSADITFISRDTEGSITVFWRVEKDEPEFDYPTIKFAKHTNNLAKEEGQFFTYFYPVDNYTVWDNHTETFPLTGGGYWVVVEAYKADKKGNVIEDYYNEVYVFVPENPQENVEVSSFYQPKKTGDGGFSFEDLGKKLQSEETVFLALGLLLPPLLFSLAIKLFSGSTLSEGLLKETFYVQCYYFSPIAILFWATQYANRFLTPDIFMHYDAGVLILYLPLILAVFWFISVQTYMIANERGIQGWQAFLIVIGCVFILAFGVLYVVFFNEPQISEGTRAFSIWSYPILAVVLLTAYHLLLARQKRDTNSKFSVRDFVMAGVSALIIIGVVVFVRLAGVNIYSRYEFDYDQLSLLETSLTQIALEQQSPQSDTVDQSESVGNTDEPLPSSINETPVGQTVVATPTPQQSAAASTPLPELQKYYTEEFNDSLDAWPYFLTRGDENVADFYLDDGKLYFQLIQQDEKKPWIYLINRLFTYDNVQLETFVTNNGSNANGVSLICHYNESGWYEFMISNGGTYTIYAYDAGNRFYHKLAEGGSSAIKTGLSTNVYSVICQDDELTLAINGRVVTTTTDSRFKFSNGLIGVAVSSPQGLPVNVDFEYITVSEP